MINSHHSYIVFKLIDFLLYKAWTRSSIKQANLLVVDSDKHSIDQVITNHHLLDGFAINGVTIKFLANFLKNSPKFYNPLKV